jgi:hypothetical protein
LAFGADIVDGGDNIFCVENDFSMVIETLSKCQQLAQCPLIDCPQALQRDESLLNCPERLESSERHQKTAIALGRSGPCRSLDGPPWHFWRSALANDNGHA